MANDVSIIVSADLGDTLIKLGAAKAAVEDLGKTNAEASISTDENTASQGRLSRSLGFVTGSWKTLVPVMTAAGVAILAFTGNMGVLLPLVPVLTALLAGLLAPFTSLVAIMASLVAPLSLISGLLGLLGVGFLLAAKRAADGGGKLSEFSQKLDTLHSMFSKTTDILAHAFLPYLLKLADAAEKALLFIDKLASGSLTNAFKLMSTQGVQMLNSFFQGIAGVLAHPIRIAFKLAFGEGPAGNEIASAVAGWWHQFTDYLFGYSNTHQIHIGKFLGPMTTTQVDGVLKPFMDWFGRQHFTATGMRWAIEAASAFVDAFGTALKHALGTSGGKMILGGGAAGAGIGAVIGGPIGAALGAAIGIAAGIALNHYWPKIAEAAKKAFGPRLWNDIGDAVKTVGNLIANWRGTLASVGAAFKRAVGPQLWADVISLAKSFWNWLSGIGHVIATVIWPAVKRVWDALGGWHTVIVIIVTALRVVVAAFVLVGEAVRTVYDFLKSLFGQVRLFASIVGGALLGAWNAVAGVVNSIVGAISSAIGAAKTLAGVLGSAGGGKGGVVAQGVSGYVPGSGTGGASGKVSFHFHAASGQGSIAERAAFSRFTRQVGAELGRQQARLAVGH